MRTRAATLAILFTLVPTSARAERVILKDGSVLQGQLLSYAGGFYEIQIGKFVKKIAETSIVTVEGDGAAEVRPAAPAAPVTSITPPAAPPPGASLASPVTPPATAPFTPPAAPAIPGLPDLSQLQNMKDLSGLDLGKLGQMTQMLGPMLQSAGRANDPSLAPGTALNEILGGIMRESSVMSQGAEAASKSPGFRQLHARLADPAFQQQLMQELRALQQQSGGAEAGGMIQMLEGLLGQLTPPPGTR